MVSTRSGVRRVLARLFRALVGLSAALAALVVVALAILPRILSEGWLTARVPAELSAMLVGRFSATSVRWDFPLSITVLGLVVEDPEGMEVLRVERLSAAVAPAGLLRGTLLIAPVELDRPRVRLVSPPPAVSQTRGPFTLVDAFMPRQAAPARDQPSGFRPSIELSRIALFDGEVEARIEAHGVSARRIALEAAYFRSADDTLVVGGSLRVGEVVLSVDAPNATTSLEVGPLAIDAKGFEYADRGPDGASLALGGLSASLDGSRLSLSASLDHLLDRPSGHVEGRAEVHLDEPNLARLMPEPLARAGLAGQASITLEADGALDDGSLHFAIRGAPLSLGDLALECLTLRARTRAGALEIDALSLDALPKASLSLRGCVADFSSIFDRGVASLAPFAHRLSLEARAFPIRALARSIVDPSLLPERVDAAITLEGPALRPLDSKLEGKLAVMGLPEALTGGYFGNLDLALAAQIAVDHARISSFEAKTDGLTVSGAGRVPFDPQGALDTRVSAVLSSPKALLAKLGANVELDSAKIDLLANGKLASPRGAGSFLLAGLRAPGLADPARVQGDVAYAEGRIVLQRTLVEAGPARANLSGAARVADAQGRVLAEPEISAHLELEGLPLGPLVADRLSGSLAGAFDFLGTPSRPMVRARIEPGVLRAGRLEVFCSPLLVEGGPAMLTLAPASLRPVGGEGSLLVDGRLEPSRRMFAANVRLDDLSLAVVDALSMPAHGLEGRVDGALHAGGALTRPTFTATLAISGLGVDGQSVGDVELEAESDGSTARGGLMLTGAAGRVDARGSYSIEHGRLDFQLTSVALALSRVPGLETLGIDGRLAIDLVARGALDAPALSGSVGVRELTLDEASLGDGRLELKLATAEDGQYVLDATALGAIRSQGRFVRSVGGSLPIAGEFAITFTDLAPETIVPSLNARGIAARLSGGAKLVVGMGSKPVTGDLTIGALDASFGPERLSAKAPIVIQYDGEALTVEALELLGSSGRFTASGRVGDTIDLSAEGDLQLAFLEPFIPSVTRMSGRARIDAKIRGPKNAPEILGEVLLLSPATIRPRGRFREIGIDALRLALSPKSVRLIALSGRLGGGRFRVGGELDLLGLAVDRWNLRLDAEGIPFQSEEILVEGDAHLLLEGRGAVPKVKGQLSIVRGRYARNFRLQDFVFVARAEEETEREPLSPWVSSIPLDLHAKSVGAVDVKVDAQVFSMKAALVADLFIRGSVASPRVEGRVRTESGAVAFPAASLDVTRATIDFVPTPSAGIRPVVDVMAEGEVQIPAAGPNDPRPAPYQVSMKIHGTSDAMQLQLSSTPSLPQDQVLSLVILGQVDPTTLIDRRGGAGGPSRVTSSLAFAGSQLAAPMTRFVERQLEEKLNLNLELGTEVSSERLRLTAAKELTSRFRLEGGYERSFTTGTNTTTGRALLFLSSSVFFEGTAANVSGLAGVSQTGIGLGTSGSLELKLRILGD